MPAQTVPIDFAETDPVAPRALNLSLRIDSTIPSAIQARVTYAFRVFAAIYGYRVADSGPESQSVRVFYGPLPTNKNADTEILIPALYDGAREHVSSSPRTKPIPFRLAGETIPLFLGLDSAEKKPDWLGEIFLWLSGELESYANLRDAVGRVPFEGTPFGRFGLSPRKPYAALLMAGLEYAIRGNKISALPKAPSPLASAAHLVLPSHDIDFYFDGRRSAFVRLAKNIGIGARTYRSSSYCFDNLQLLSSLLAGKRPGSYLFPLLNAAESAGFRSTLFPVVRRAHRRDPNYSLESIASSIANALAKGFSVGLHGSYRSVAEERSLRSEATRFGERFGKRPKANRQHWLRFASQRALFREVEIAGMLADSSIGFPETVGFRNGASFAFPPYDFDKERPHRLLEVPLVLMDGGLEAEARRLGTSPAEIAEEVLTQSRNMGWGGISILWHNPIEPLSVPGQINDVFWQLAADRRSHTEAWLTFEEFLNAAVPRYQQAGLLEGVPVHA